MAVFRVERNTGYTVMSNHHLRNKELSLKAKGLLSQMLSLPEDWDYTLAGLSYINREKYRRYPRPPFGSLNAPGTSQRSRERDEQGTLDGELIMLSMNSRSRSDEGVAFADRQPPISEKPTVGITRYWKIRQRIILCWKNLRRKIQRN